MIDEKAIVAAKRIAQVRRAVYVVGLSFLIVFALLAVVPMLAVGSRMTKAGTPQIAPEAARDLLDVAHTFPNTITINEMRVTLLSVGREVIFEKDDRGTRKAVPYVEIMFTVESLAKDSVKAWNDGAVEIDVNGQHAHTNFQSVYNYDFDRMPAGPWTAEVSDVRRASGRKVCIREDGLPTGLATLTLHQGVNGKTETFRFNDVPLR